MSDTESEHDVANDGAASREDAPQNDQERTLAELRAEIAVGLRDIGAGRVYAFDPEDIKRRGRLRSIAGERSG